MTPESHGWPEVAFRCGLAGGCAVADELAAAGEINESIAAELEVSGAAVYNRRRALPNAAPTSASATRVALNICSTP